MDALAAKEAIRDVIMTYCRAVDRRDWELLRTVYHDDATDSHGMYDGDAAGFVNSTIQRQNLVVTSLHMVLNCMVRVDGTHAVAETYCLATMISRPDADPWPSLGEPAAWPGADADLVVETRFLCRYIDELDERKGRWAITTRAVVFDDVLRTTRPAAYLPPGMIAGRRSRDDHLYRVWGSDVGPQRST